MHIGGAIVAKDMWMRYVEVSRDALAEARRANETRQNVRIVDALFA